MQSILRLPRPTIPRRQPKRDTVAKVVPIDQAGQEADPVHKGEGRVLRDGEAVAADLDGLLQPDGRQGVEGNVKAEADGVEAGDEKEGLDCYC